MEKIKTKKKAIGIDDILVCPNCHGSLSKNKNCFFCSSCNKKYDFQEGIPILLPDNFRDSPDFSFKKSQIGFFDEWSQNIKKSIPSTSSFEKFFSTEVGKKKFNYSEREMTKVIGELPKNSWILELGCGAGEHSVFLAKLRKDVNLVMIDISLNSVLETKKKFSELKLEGKHYFLVADTESLPFKEKTLSGIIAVMFFHHLFSLKKSFSEIKRTLKTKGVCLVVDLVSDNPLITYPRKLFKLFPEKVKQRFTDDYVLKNGKIPDIKLHSSKEFEKVIEDNKLKVVREDRYDLFLHIFADLGMALPQSRILMTEKVLDFLYNMEKKMLKSRFISNFAGTRTIWLSR